MKILSKLPIIFFLGLTNTQSTLANVYRVDFTFGGPTQGGGASLQGFMTIDNRLGNYATDSQSDLGFTDIPDWITGVSLTYNPGGGGSAVTTTSFDKVIWNLKPGNVNNFDLYGNFTDQFDGFGFRGANNDYASGNTDLLQQHLNSEDEFPFNSTTTTPGGLPFLGLGALAFYYKKLKNKSFKL